MRNGLTTLGSAQARKFCHHLASTWQNRAPVVCRVAEYPHLQHTIHNSSDERTLEWTHTTPTGDRCEYYRAPRSCTGICAFSGLSSADQGPRTHPEGQVYEREQRETITGMPHVRGFFGGYCNYLSKLDLERAQPLSLSLSFSSLHSLSLKPIG